MASDALKYRVELSGDQSYVLVAARGRLNTPELVDATNEVVDFCERQGVQNLLIDTREVEISGHVREIISATRPIRNPAFDKLKQMNRVALVSNFSWRHDLVLRMFRLAGHNVTVTTDEDQAIALASMADYDDRIFSENFSTRPMQQIRNKLHR